MQEIWMKQLRLLSTRIHHYPMDKSNIFKYHNQFWFVIFSSFLFWLFFLYFNSKDLMSSKNEVRSLVNDYPNSVFFGMSNSVVEPISRSLPIMNSDTVQPPFNRLPDGNNREEPIIGLPIEDNKEEPIRKSSAIENRVEFVNKQVSTAGNKVQPIKEKPVDGLAITENQAKPVRQPPVMTNKIEPVKQLPTIEDKVVSDSDSCLGSYIYVHNLPKRFNYDMLKKCRSLSLWTNMCRFMTNAGLGPQLSNSERVFSNTGWFATNQFALDVIFHYRMKQYKCITNDSSMASAIFVPFYAGLDAARYLWGYNTSMRDLTSLDLVKWLRARPEWKVLGGKDHFLVAGRITWDFRRSGNENSDWGNELMVLPEVKNMSMIVIESSPWHSNDFAIPYPTYFHPSRENEVFQWQTRMRRIKRRFLFSFAGAPRPNLTDSIRNQIIDQCRSASRRKCKLLDCDSGGNKCHNPNSVMKMFQSSVFCLQPSGDSFTRRSAFDSFLAGCIPVFFHPGSAYVQYTWHLPRNYKKYSVFIPENEVREGKVNIERHLLRIPKEKVRAMRLEVIKLIPRLIYADPRGRLETLEDAFDLAVKGVLKRVDRVRKEIIDGDSSDVGYKEENSWKYSLLGTVEEHEWEPFFYRPRKIN